MLYILFLLFCGGCSKQLECVNNYKNNIGVDLNVDTLEYMNNNFSLEMVEHILRSVDDDRIQALLEAAISKKMNKLAIHTISMAAMRNYKHKCPTNPRSSISRKWYVWSPRTCPVMTWAAKYNNLQFIEDVILELQDMRKEVGRISTKEFKELMNVFCGFDKHKNSIWSYLVADGAGGTILKLLDLGVQDMDLKGNTLVRHLIDKEGVGHVYIEKVLQFDQVHLKTDDYFKLQNSEYFSNNNASVLIDRVVSTYNGQGGKCIESICRDSKASIGDILTFHAKGMDVTWDHFLLAMKNKAFSDEDVKAMYKLEIRPASPRDGFNRAIDNGRNHLALYLYGQGEVSIKIQSITTQLFKKALLTKQTDVCKLILSDDFRSHYGNVDIYAEDKHLVGDLYSCAVAIAIEQKEDDVLRLMLDHNPSKINNCFKHGPLLFQAVKAENIKAVQLLRIKNANIKKQWKGHTLLSYAVQELQDINISVALYKLGCKTGMTKQFLKGMSIFSEFFHSDPTNEQLQDMDALGEAILFGAKENLIEKTQTYLKHYDWAQGFNVDSEQRTCLYYFVNQGCWAIVDGFIRSNMIDEFTRRSKSDIDSPISLLIQKERWEIVSNIYLMMNENYDDKNIKDYIVHQAINADKVDSLFLNLALYFAAQCKNDQHYKTLLGKGADPICDLGYNTTAQDINNSNRKRSREEEDDGTSPVTPPLRKRNRL